jgi:L-asparaginase type I
MTRPKIKVLFAGGTIGMIRNRRTGALEPAEDMGPIFQIMPELQREMQLDFEPVMNIDSTNMTPAHWATLAERIKKNYNHFDGFVVAQGTDTMAYTASALSFALQSLSKPIICTGALMPLNELGTDGRNNFIYACRLATYDLAEVAIVFGSKVIRGNRATKYREAFFDVFESPNFPLLGEILRPITLNDWRKKRRKRIPKFMPTFNGNVAVIKLFPGFNGNYLNHLIDSDIEGIILEGFGPGNIPRALITAIQRGIDKKIPIVVSTQMAHGRTNLEAYEVGYKALKSGVIETKDMTTESCVTKLMWVLSQTKNMHKIRKMMLTDYAGEITI